MGSRRRFGAAPFVAGVLLASAARVSAFVAGIASPALPGTSCAAIGAWGYDEDVRGNKLAGREQRWDARLAVTSEDVDTPSTGDSGGGEDEDAVWARAGLPLSNDVQVEQATRAVWQVTTCSPTKAMRLDFKREVLSNFLSIACRNRENKPMAVPTQPPPPVHFAPNRLCLTARTARF